MRNVSTIILIFILHLHGICQNQKTLTGKIIDSETKEGLPYATIGFPNNYIGTVTNESGDFKFIFSDTIKNDSLVINYLGYKSKTYDSKQVETVMNIELTASSVSLTEFIVLPQPPEFYIQLAVKAIPNNYASQAYNYTSYYKESFAENGNYIKLDECVFESYSKDTINMQQLVLHKETTDPYELNFMKQKRKKRKRKALKKGKTSDNIKPSFDFGEFFGGPKTILKLGNINNLEPFIDSISFKKFDYNFEPSTTYNGNEVMVINFSSKSRIDKSKYVGQLFIDKTTNAFVAIDYTENTRIPTALKPILFLVGISISNPIFNIRKVYQEQSNDRWYPKSFQLSIQFGVTKKYMFNKNEHSKFNIKQHFNINKINIANVKSIEKVKQFDASKKDYKSQIHNANNINWKNINTLD
tara:strand:- start:953 stop:2191 length:1239 start_codon:yes stop_codon:yes gene_type:complete